MTQFAPIRSPGIPLICGGRGAALVILLHAWCGRLPWLERYADALAGQGYRVIVLGLCDGRATTKVAAESLLAQLDMAGALSILDGIIQRARADGSLRTGDVGFSLGGWLALVQAQWGAADAVVA